jgi:processive 1,2-diacylglycerol beta-glucosyltransferase
MALRILILSTSVGGGHVRAAQAVETVVRQRLPDATVQHVDVMELTNATFRRLYDKAYFSLAYRMPHLLAYFYDWLDQPTATRSRSRGDRLRLLLEKLNLRRFIRFMEAAPWDLVINTHYLPAEIIASLRRKERLNVPQVTVTTDFDTHRMWVNPPCDHYFTATEEGRHYLFHQGVPLEQTTAVGIPIHPAFSQPKDREACRAKFGLKNDRPVVLQLSGGFGHGPMEKLFRSLLDVEEPSHLVTISGKNAKLREQLQMIEPPPRHSVKVVGFTQEMDEWLAAADVVVSKPGGLTSAEVLARGAAMVIVNPIPGQEDRNSDFLMENGAAIKANHLATLPYKVTTLLRDRERLQQLRANAQRLGRPRAAFDVVEQSLKMLEKMRGLDPGRAAAPAAEPS